MGTAFADCGGTNLSLTENTKKRSKENRGATTYLEGIRSEDGAPRKTKNGVSISVTEIGVFTTLVHADGVHNTPLKSGKTFKPHDRKYNKKPCSSAIPGKFTLFDGSMIEEPIVETERVTLAS